MSRTTPEDRFREEQVRRLTTDEVPVGGQKNGEDVYAVELRPKKAKTRDRAEEERLRIKMLTYDQASD